MDRVDQLALLAMYYESLARFYFMVSWADPCANNCLAVSSSQYICDEAGDENTRRY